MALSSVQVMSVTQSSPVRRSPPDLANDPIDQTVHENRIYSLKITCGESYPDAPPDIQFLSRVNLPFVNSLDGKVDRAKLPVLASWNRNSSIEHILVEIRKWVAICSVPDTLALTHLLLQGNGFD